MERNTYFVTHANKMRQSIGFILLIFGINLMNAQVAYHEFSQIQKTFTLLENPTILATATGASGPSSLDDVVYNIADNTIPFSFNFNNIDYTGLKVFTNGYVAFGTIETIKNRPVSENTAYDGVISAMGADLNGLFQVNGKTAQISYKTIGTAPNRSFVIEYLHFRPYSTSTSTSSYFDWNFQIHLNENQTIEIVYDLQVTGTPSSELLEVGLRGSTNADFNSRKANGVSSSNWTSTTASIQNTDRITTNSSTLPPSGYSFKWEKTSFCLPVYQYSADPVTRVVFNTIDNVSTSTVPTTPIYEDFTNISTDLTKGQTYPISIKGPSSTFPSDVMVYIDFNQNGLFDDAGESFYIGRLEPQNPFNALTITSNILIPSTALNGPTKMRIVKNTNVSALANPDAPNAVSGPCATNMRSGQVEEYTLNLQGTSTTPAVQTVVVTTQNNVAAQITAVNGTLPLLATVNPSGANQEVTWSIASGAAFVSLNNEGIVTAIANGTATVRATSVSDTTKFGEIQITVNIPTDSYCTSEGVEGYSLPIYEFNFNNIQNLSANQTDASPLYEDFTNQIFEVSKGNTYPVTVKGKTDGQENILSVVYIDINHDFQFTDNEAFNIGMLSNTGGENGTVTGSVTIPQSALSGSTRMRVVNMYYNPSSTNGTFINTPCPTAWYLGQIEDYTIQISEGVTPPAVQTVVVTTQNNVPAQISALNETLQLVATINPAGANQEVTWSVVSGQTFVSVNTTGIVTGIANGTATVRATSVADPAKFGEIQVTVNQALSVENVMVTVMNNAEAKIIVQNETLPLVATVNPSGVSQNVTWSVAAGASFASVSTTGVVTGITNGTAIIRATSVADTTKFGEIEVIIDIPTASVDDFVKQHIKVYPNPAVDVLNFDSDLTLESIEVYDMTGKKVIETKQTQINIQHIASGIYQVKIVFENQKAGFIKIIKK